MTEKPNAAMLADIVKDCREAAKIREQNNYPLSALDVAHIYERIADSIERAAAPSPHPRREEPVAWCGWHPDRGFNFATAADTQQRAISLLLRTGIAGNHGWEVRSLYAAPPPAGADAVRVSTIGECAKICDRWIRSKNLHEHLAATDIAAAIRALPTSQPQEKPDGAVASAKGTSE